MSFLDLVSQTWNVLRKEKGGTANPFGWAEGAIVQGQNSTGSTIALGSVVKLAGTYDDTRITPVTTVNDPAVLGVVVGRYIGSGVRAGEIEAVAPANGEVAAVMRQGVARVLVSAAVTRGQYLYPSGTSGQAAGSDRAVIGTFGIAFTSTSTATLAVIGQTARSNERFEYVLRIEDAVRADRARHQVVTVTNSFGGNVGSYAVDGDSTTYWLSGTAPSVPSPQDIVVDLGASGYPTASARYVFVSTDRGTDWVLAGSNDNSTYTTIATITGNSSNDRMVTFASEQTWRYYRSRFTAANNKVGIYTHSLFPPGAANVSIYDAGAYFTGETVEAALQELGASSTGDLGAVVLTGTPGVGDIMEATSATTAVWTENEAKHIHIVGEPFTGNGSQTLYYLADEAEPHTIAAYAAGLRTEVTVGTFNDTVTFAAAPANGAAIRIDYLAVRT